MQPSKNDLIFTKIKKTKGTKTLLYYSTGESIFAYDIEKGSSREVDKGIFIGGSENKCLFYSIDDKAYYLIDTN